MEAFRWLNDLAQWLGKLFPRLLLVKAYEAGVRFGPSGSSVPLLPGLHVFWPIIHEVTVLSTRRRSIELAIQMHGNEGIGLVAFWEICDAPLCLREIEDPVSYVDDVMQAALREAYEKGPQQDGIMRAELIMCVGVEAAMRVALGGKGINVTRVSVVQRTKPIPVKL